jgi:hypothetical protein
MLIENRYYRRGLIDLIGRKFKKVKRILKRLHRAMFYSWKIELIIRDVKSNKNYEKCFYNVEKEVKNWTNEQIRNYEFDY